MDSFCSLGLYLYGHSMSLDGASSLLRLEPTSSRSRGEVRTSASGAQIEQKISYWEYRLRVNPGELASSILELLNPLSDKTVVGTAGIEKAEVDIFVPLDPSSEENGCSFELDSNLLSRLSKLGFDVIVTVR